MDNARLTLKGRDYDSLYSASTNISLKDAESQVVTFRHPKHYVRSAWNKREPNTNNACLRLVANLFDIESVYEVRITSPQDFEILLGTVYTLDEISALVASAVALAWDIDGSNLSLVVEVYPKLITGLDHILDRDELRQIIREILQEEGIL
jgi:hypothetical protein